MWERMEAIDRGLPLCVAVIVTGMPLMILVLSLAGHMLGLDKLNDHEWDTAQRPPRSSLSCFEQHLRLLKNARIWGYVWIAGAVAFPMFVWGNSGPQVSHYIRDFLLECGLANFLAALAFLAVVEIDRRLNLPVAVYNFYLVRNHLPGLLYAMAVTGIWVSLFIAALLN